MKAIDNLEKIENYQPSSLVNNWQWLCLGDNIDYNFITEKMEKRAYDIRHHNAPESIWLLQHPHLYTLGIRGCDDDFRVHDSSIPKYKTNRGGQTTYHGPGQLIIYVMMDLRKRCYDVRSYINFLENWLIILLSRYHIYAESRCNRVGLWVKDDKIPSYENKIAAIGVRLKKWVSYHGIALNVAPDLKKFDSIVPCGISNPYYGVTSLEKLQKNTNIDTITQDLKDIFFNDITLKNSQR